MRPFVEYVLRCATLPRVPGCGRFTGPGHASVVMADYLRRKYSRTNIDAIIAVYPQAVEFLLAHKHALFHGVPIIACQINRNFVEASNIRRHAASSPVRPSETTSLACWMMAPVRPGTKRAALVAGTTPNDEYSAEISRRDQTYPDRLTLIDLTKLPMGQMLKRVGSLPPDTVILYAGVLRDGAGQQCAP